MPDGYAMRIVWDATRVNPLSFLNILNSYVWGNGRFAGLTGIQALIAMRQMHSEKAVLPELTEQFEAAEIWLRPMRP